MKHFIALVGCVVYLIVSQAPAFALSDSAIPTKIPTWWGELAGSPYITCPVPTPSQVSITAGRASWTTGFPPLTFTPVASGGVPPFGQDMNGALCQISQWTQWQNAGAPTFYDSVFSTAVSGYPAGAVVANASTAGCFWVSTADNNTSNPDTGGANWNASCPGGGIGGASTGSANSQVVTTTPFALSSGRPLAGTVIAYKAGYSNTLALQVNVNSTGLINVYRHSQRGATLSVGGETIAGQMVTLQYDGSVWQCQSCAVAYVGEEKIHTGPASTVPAGYAIENGACVSLTTYADLYAVYGSTDTWSPGSTGGACSSGYFHLKFANGQGSFASNTQGGQTGPLTNCTATVGATCGAQTETIAQANLPNVSFTNSGIAVINGGNTGIAVTNGGNTGIAVNNGTPTIPVCQNGLTCTGGSGLVGFGDTGTIAGNMSGVATNVSISAQGNSNVYVSSQGNSSVYVSSQGSAASGGSGTALPIVPPINSNIFIVKL
jgi:hypothetical protein